MKMIAAFLLGVTLAFAGEPNIQYGVRTSSVKTNGGYIGTYQFSDTTLTIRFPRHAISHVRYDFANHILYGQGDKVEKDGTVVPAAPREPKMQEIRAWEK